MGKSYLFVVNSTKYLVNILNGQKKRMSEGVVFKSTLKKGVEYLLQSCYFQLELKNRIFKEF